MTESQRQKVFEVLRGLMPDDKTTADCLAMIASADTDALEPLIDDMLQQAENRGRLAVYLEMAAKSEAWRKARAEVGGWRPSRSRWMEAMRNKLLDGRGTSPAELLLIRAGHHLWGSRKREEWPLEPLDASLSAIWMAKEALRVELRKEYLESMEKSVNGLAKWRAKQKQG
jgi:hypothetical protein